jgi:Protein of unknown function (DUF4244)
MGKDITAVVGDLVVPVDGAHGTLQLIEGVEGDLAEPDCCTVARRSQRGMVSAEWAVGIVAAVAIAGVLLAVITSGQVQDALLKFILWVIKGFISVVD